ncbi:MAG: sigma 54-interacting transcriptional regulator [Deltaproteobacteria bacterium]|nr:sigma 54-interacting transcriptional regulator [Deltaproteobacteria bacterium]
MPSEVTSSTHLVGAPTALVRRPGRLRLRVLDGPQAGQEVDIEQPVVQVGRSTHADFMLDHGSVSKLHFELRTTDYGAELRDLNSKNGTWFGKRRVFRIGLAPGDTFMAGDCGLELIEVNVVEVEVSQASRCGELYGSSLAMRELYVLIGKIAPTPLDVLILGETGTGKELTARTIHQLSARARQPFVVLDCGSLPHTLAEGTLFGYRRGRSPGPRSALPGCSRLRMVGRSSSTRSAICRSICRSSSCACSTGAR